MESKNVSGYYTPRATSPNQFANDNLPKVDSTIKQDGRDVKEGLGKAIGASGDSFEGTSANVQDAKGKAKEAGTKLSDAKDDLSKAGKKVGEGLGNLVDGGERVADQAAEHAGEAREGLNQAGTGLFNIVRRPAVWAANKVSTLTTNVLTPRLGERFSPRLGAGLLIAGLTGFGLAAASSISTAFLVTLPTVALATAAIGASVMFLSLANRAIRGPSAPSTAEGVLATGTVADRTGADMEEIRKSGLTQVQTDLAAVRKKQAKLVKEQANIAARNAKLATEEAQLLKQEAIHESYKIARQDVAILAEAEAINPESLPPVKAAEVKIVATTSDVQQGNEAELNTEIKHGGNLGAEALQPA